MIIPLVLISLVIMAILGVVLMSSSAAEYSQSALVGYGLRARELALAALEEARSGVYDRVNRPNQAAPAPWHVELFTQCKQRAATERGVLLQKDLKGEGLVDRAKQLASAAGGDIVSADLVFFGFKPITYLSDSDLFTNPESFYKNPEANINFGPDQGPPREYTGFYRVKVVARFGKVSRTLSEVHDMKIVSVAPSARAFALFANEPTSDGSGNAVTQRGDTVVNNLNQGGRFRVFPNGKGRVFVRGPFVVEGEGFSGGNGGQDAPRMMSGYTNDDWHGWRMVPATRDGIVTRAGPAIINFGVAPMRPDSTGKSRLMPLDINALVGGLGAVLGDDPGWYILPGQRWFCERLPRDGRSFSIIGDPPGGQVSYFRGVLVQLNQNNRTPLRVDSFVEPLGRSIAGLGDNETRFAVEPEGALIGRWNLVSYSYSDFKLFPFGPKWERYRVNGAGMGMLRFGIFWEKKYEQSYWNRFFSDIFNAGSAVLFGGAIGGLIPALAPLAMPALFLGPTPLALGLIAAGLGASLTAPGNFQALNGLNAAQAKGTLPPGYRIMERSVTRRYPALKDLPCMNKGGGPPEVIVDGVLWFDDLTTTKGFFYRGAGALYSSNADRAPKMIGAISPKGDPGLQYLTVHYEPGFQNRTPSDEAQHMLEFDAANGQARVIASVYSTQGVKTDAPMCQIVGNLVCGFVNKQFIDGNAGVRVDYRLNGTEAMLSPADPAEFDSGKWHVSAISHRISTLVDR